MGERSSVVSQLVASEKRETDGDPATAGQHLMEVFQTPDPATYCMDKAAKAVVKGKCWHYLYLLAFINKSETKTSNTCILLTVVIVCITKLYG